MKGFNSLTRVVTDDDDAVEIAQFQSVLRRIQKLLPGIPAAQRAYIAKALLANAVATMRQGRRAT